MNRPNLSVNMNVNKYRSNNSVLGENMIYRRFKKQFQALLAFDNNESSVRGRYYNKVDDKMKNMAYVSQENYEKELLEFKNSSINDTKFLVGFSGIGKTMLIKNTFGIDGRKPFIDSDSNLIAYLSFFSKSLDDEVSGGLETVLVRFIKSICYCITGHRSFVGKADEFYDFVDTVNGDLLDNLPILPDKIYGEEEMLAELEKNHKREYYECLLKYYMYTQGTSIKSIIIIVDDIESTKPEDHIKIIEKALNISNCLSNTLNRTYTVKLLLSMRAYTFRYNQSRQSAANRIDEDNLDVITKETIPAFKDIINSRFEVIMKYIDEFKDIGNQTSWKSAKKELDKVINQLDFNFGELIAGLTHNNISRSMKIFLKILSNERWFALSSENETTPGVLKVSAENYEYYHKESVLKAMVYGEGNVYYDYSGNIVPNLLHYHNEECEGTELLGLYILKYFLRTNQNEVVLYGKNSIKGVNAVDRILKVFNKKEDAEFYLRIDYMMRYLYNKGLLLHSIFEPEHPGEEERDYHDNYLLYISLRALSLLNIMENSSILMEFYRDDIDTKDILNSDKLSTELSFKSKMSYILDYLKYLFQIEKRYISLALPHLNDYIKMFGNTYLVSSILLGVIISINKYYDNANEEATDVVTKIRCFIYEMNEYSKELDGMGVNAIVINSKISEYY